MTNEDILKELRLNNAILKAVHRQTLETMANELAAEPISQAVIEHLTANPGCPAGEVKTAVEQAVPSVSERTLARRIAHLENLGVIERQGAGRSVSYHLTGLIS